MPRVYEGQCINQADSFNSSFCLDAKNDSERKLTVLYIYRLPLFREHGLKVGMATCHQGEVFWDAIRKRIAQQKHELALSEEQYAKYADEREVLYWGVCTGVHNDSFKDYLVHDKVKSKLAGIVMKEQEWFINVALDELIKIFDDLRREGFDETKYTPRNEQRECVDRLKEYFSSHPGGGRFLMNCKMRFGKCYTTYKYCEENGIDKVLILTFIPAVQKSWEEDLYHIEKKYDYFTDDDLRKAEFDLSSKKGPYVLFLSLQNYLGKDGSLSETKAKIKKLQSIDFDLVVFDEYHFGAWNDRTQETLEDVEESYAKAIKAGAGEQDILKKFNIKTRQTICLSGTPFKALARGEFTDENTFTYSYFDEQKNKYPHHERDDFKSEVNPAYAEFPDMKILGYNMSLIFQGLNCNSNDKILGKPYFSLNKFFETRQESNKSIAKGFANEEEIKRWLSIISGRDPVAGMDFPYSNMDMRENAKHTLWLMPTIASCEEMRKLLERDDYFRRYEIVNLSAPDVGCGQKALGFLEAKINKAQNTNKLGTIAITVNKLTMGVTVKPWSSVFVLKDLASPESYFQSIFRIQTPYVENGEIKKKEGFVFDFNVDRAAALMLRFAGESQDRKTTRMDISKLIVKYMPIYLNGNMSSPISYEVFYDLAEYGDSNGVPLSKKVTKIERTTRLADDEVISNVLNDPDASAVLKKAFAHAKFKKQSSQKRTPPAEPTPGSNTEAFKKGMEAGYAIGVSDHQKYIDFDDVRIQDEFEGSLEKLEKENTPQEYDEEKRVYYVNGFRKGYEAGVNAPIKKLQCGKKDGEDFAEKLKKEHGNAFYYEGDNKRLINDAIAKKMNDPDPLPKEYQGKSLYTRWYKESFKKAAQNYLKRPKAIGPGESVEEASNVIRHLISRLFQFLYISVYRETTFDEIFRNAKPEIFLEAVGITKEDFEILNKYHIFQEDVLNNYIHEFFVNESLGASLSEEAKDNGNYRNSFGWFGFQDVHAAVREYVSEALQEPNEETAQATDNEVPGPALEESIPAIEEAEKKETMIIPSGLSKIGEKIYAAIWNITDLEAEIHCKPTLKTIKNYLTGNSSSVFYPSFHERPGCGSVGFFEAFKIDKALKALVADGVVEEIQGKKTEYRLRKNAMFYK